MDELRFTAPPSVSLLRLGLRRAPGLRAGDRLPRLSARLVGARVGDDPRWRALCGYPDGGPAPLPWPFLAAAALHKALLAHPAFPLPAMGLVHLRQTLRAARPLMPDEMGDLVVEGGDWRPARRGVEFDLQTRFEVQGQEVWGGTTTAWSPAGPGHGEDRARPSVPEPAGDPVPLEVPEDLGRRYARVSGDFNPIHWHAWTARPFGFRRAIIHGMWTLSRALALAGAGLGPVDARFLAPVPLPSAPVLRVDPPGPGPRRLRVDLDGRPCLVATLGPTDEGTTG